MSSDTHTDPAAEPDDGSLDPEPLIDRLTASDVLATGEDGRGELRLAEPFRDLVREARRRIREDGRAAIEADLGDAAGEPVEELLSAGEDVAAEYLALARADGEGVTRGDRLRSLPLVDTLGHEVPAEGSPEPFVPVRGSLLPVVLPLYERAIVYTWREDCPPCDLMREGFEAVFEEPPEDIALLSAYGPAHAETLQEQYDVVGGPTTLFCHRGTVDARLTGGHARQIIGSEVRKLREVAASDG
jgi:hypothetical protein